MRSPRAVQRALAATVVVTALTVSATACGSSSSGTASPAETSPSPSALPSTPTSPVGSPGGEVTPGAPNGPASPPSLSVSPTASPQDGLTATATPAGVPTDTDPLAAARLGLTTWAHPDRSYTAWWAALSPLMSAAGRQAYADTDPAEIPTLRVLGTPRLVTPSAATAGTAITARVDLATTRGPFGVDLSRTDSSAGWQVARFYLPASVE